VHNTEKTERKKTAYLHYVDAFLWDFINIYAKIGGIFIGSDNQGGAHYGNPNPCSFTPTDFVGVLQVSGKKKSKFATCGLHAKVAQAVGISLDSS